MKKVTLSAAILALSMMGCSDVGLDNSVASTNEVKSEQKASNSFSALMKSSYEEGSFAPGYLYRTSDWAFSGSSEMDDHSKRGIGRFTIDSWRHDKIDVVNAITLTVANCYYTSATSAECQYVDWFAQRWFDVQYGRELINQTQKPWKFANVNHDKLTTISQFAGVWDYNQPDQVIMTGTTYAGYLWVIDNPHLAALVAQKYMPMAAAEFAANNP